MAKYYPLIDYTDNGSVKAPMFFTDSKENVMNSSSFWLEETGSNSYILSCKEEPEKPFLIKCPKCGSTMLHESSGTYFCTKCKYNKKRSS